jgi:hypothetical protein
MAKSLMRGRIAPLLKVVAFGCACIAGSNRPLNGGEVLRMQVSPAVSRAPAILTVRVTVEPAADNRALEIMAESPTFFRSSQVQLEGDHGAPVNVFRFRDLPTGLYQVTGVLVGVHGPRATVTRLAKVEPSPGSR